MGRIGCFCGFLTSNGRNNGKDSRKSVYHGAKKGRYASELSLVSFAVRSSEKELRESTLDKVVPVRSHETSPMYEQKHGGSGFGVVKSPIAQTALEAAYDGSDEHDEVQSVTRNLSHLDLQTRYEIVGDPVANSDIVEEHNLVADDATMDLMMQSGHLSDPGIRRSTAFSGSPVLKRSCSNIERRIAVRPLLPPAKPLSSDDLQNLPDKQRKGVSFGIASSPISALSSCSADRVMLKKRSSSQVLPSRSRKIWWKLFLWSHRNLHKPWAAKPSMTFPAKNYSNPKYGYSSDTLEPDNSSGKHGKRTDQWVAFAMETTPIDRVNAWVNTLQDGPINQGEHDEYYDDDLMVEDLVCQRSFEVGESSGKNCNSRTARHHQEEVLQANHIVQSLNSLSAVAHISGTGLKVIPVISAFSSLRAVNLSSNFIVHITPGALPKSLHTLDLSRNKITTINGLRELMRLRVLNLSYNKISRIGHGLSNCTIIKELYLAGNKISNVEGLHKLLKLAVVDLSFNKICTAKSLGQLVANYHSLQALNLLGNPIQCNINDDQLRKVVSGLLPHLVYLNKQAIKLNNAREAVTDRVTRAALNDSGWNPHRRRTRRANQQSGSSVRGSGSSRHRSSSRHRHDSPTRSRRMR